MDSALPSERAGQAPNYLKALEYFGKAVDLFNNDKAWADGKAPGMSGFLDARQQLDKVHDYNPPCSLDSHQNFRMVTSARVR